MRGWPPLEAVLVIAAFVLALIPLWSFTGNGSAPAEIDVPVPETIDETLVFLTAKFVHPPTRFQVIHLGEPIWTVTEPDGRSEFHGEANLTIPPEGIDLIIEAEWAETASGTAVGLSLEPETLAKREATVWGPMPMNEVATFLWKN